jgi:hypothetical protein
MVSREFTAATPRDLAAQTPTHMTPGSMSGRASPVADEGVQQFDLQVEGSSGDAMGLTQQEVEELRAELRAAHTQVHQLIMCERCCCCSETVSVLLSIARKQGLWSTHVQPSSTRLIHLSLQHCMLNA